MTNIEDLEEVIHVLENEEYISIISQETSERNNEILKLIKSTFDKLTLILNYYNEKYYGKVLLWDKDILISWTHLYFDMVVTERQIKSITIKNYMENVIKSVKNILPTLISLEIQDSNKSLSV